MPLLEGKKALVMGVANRWSIAWAVAQAMVREGAELILTYQGDRQKGTVVELGQSLNAKQILPCDVGKDEEVKKLFDTLQGEGVRLDALVHCLAFANREDLANPFHQTSRAGFSLALDVSAYSLVATANHALPLMGPGGSVLTLTYLGSTRAVTNYNVMGVAKAALESSVRYLAGDLGPKGIRVNAISAGPIKTASARAVKDFSTMLAKVEQVAPLRKNTEQAEVADVAVFLASNLSRGMSGEILFVDGGYNIMGLA